ncbi:MAG: Na/Pi cotransporter family protein [Lachnospiraceae bacterium]|nr:Na/Pi cotransporter family protein [Lachnospiraceae bacterium]
MTWANIGILAGGLVLFLFGMHLLGVGLSALAGTQMERFLERMVNSGGRALAAGAGVTALIQSSSATTVLVVKLVDAGVMRLEQAVGVIFGANIGTTVTAWLMVLAQGGGRENAFGLTSPAGLVCLSAVVGAVLLVLARGKRMLAIGKILTGWALLLFGMEALGEAMTPLGASPYMRALLVRFTAPPMALAAGAIFTALIQSSSASVAILQALAQSGSVPYRTVIPVILGQNIGTCVTSLLACVGSGRNARWAAYIHVGFNLAGAALFWAIFYGLDVVLRFDFPAKPASGCGIAGFHSIFNIVSAMLLFPGFRKAARYMEHADRQPAWRKEPANYRSVE